jgi:hypothetical protein
MSGEMFADRELPFGERINTKIARNIKGLVEVKTMKSR